MRKLYRLILLLALATPPAVAQQTMSLDDCRGLALQHNRQLAISKLQVDVARNIHQAAKTKYLPRVDGLGAYQHFTREISLLNNGQKSALNSLGSQVTGNINDQLANVISGIVQQGFVTPEAAQQLQQQLDRLTTPIATAGNNIGQTVTNAFRTNTKNVWAGTVMVTQPIYMGGAITAANKMAEISEELANNDVETRRQNVLWAVDNAYWLIVSLRNKQRTAEDFAGLLRQLSSDVHKMIDEGVATRADGLKVDVGVNTADMTVSQLKSGVSVAKMALCQLCGIDIKSDIRLADEGENGITTDYRFEMASDTAYFARPELKMLQNTYDMSLQATKLVRSAYLPHVALTGGFTEMNPNLFDGFHEKFAGVFNVGVVLHVPIWNWGERKYNVRASRAVSDIAKLQLEDARNKVHLQVEQTHYQMTDAQNRLETARKNMQSAEENLRCANIGFREGVMTVTDVMNAQTAWQTAESQKIDAEVAVKIAQSAYQKAVGIY